MSTDKGIHQVSKLSVSEDAITTPSGQTVVLEGDADEISRALSSLGTAPPAHRGPGRPPKTANGIAKDAPVVMARRLVSVEVAKRRQVHGRYLGALRKLKGADKAKVQKLAAEKGNEAALALALKLAPNK